MTPLGFFVGLAMGALAPTRDVSEVAAVVERVVASERPLFAGDEDRVRTAALVIAVAFRESSFRPDALSATGDFGLMQLHGRPDLSVEENVRVGLEMLRASIAECGASNALGAYATGSCSSERGRRISRDRLHLARVLAGEARP